MVNGVLNQIELLQSKLAATDGISTQSEHGKRELCAKREIFLDDLCKIKVAFNKANSELYKDVPGDETDLLRDIKIESTKMQKMLDLLDKKCNDVHNLLKNTDETLKLYALNKAPSAIPYPTPKFGGTPGQNIIIFLDKMRLALEANQISNQRRVLILRQLLEGQAKVIVTENIEDWDVAKKTLMDTFGNAQLLWLNLYSKTKEKLYSWSTGYAEGTSKGVNCGLDQTNARVPARC